MIVVRRQFAVDPKLIQDAAPFATDAEFLAIVRGATIPYFTLDPTNLRIGIGDGSLSATNPILGFNSDFGSGLGQAADNTVSLIASNLEGLRIIVFAGEASVRIQRALNTAVDGAATAAFTANMVGSTNGPTAAAQNGWLEMFDSGGNQIWIPVWK